jgi:hypothetical protein
MFGVFRQVVATTAALVCLCALPAAALADGYNQPVTIANNTLFTQASGAGVEADEPLTAMGQSVCGTDGPEIQTTRWYSFRGTGGPMYMTSSGSDFDTVIGVYEGPAPAPIGASLFCSNDRGDNDADSQVELSTTDAGREYLLQVGGCNNDVNAAACPFANAQGRTGLAAFAAVGNDSRSFPETVPAATPVTRTNAGASTEGGEPTTCGGASLGKSVWFRYNATAAGRARFEAVGFDVVLGVYRGGRLACNDDTGDSNTSEVSLDVTPGAYLVQIAGKGAGEAATFGNFRYRADFTPAPVVVPPVVVTPPPVVVTPPAPQPLPSVRSTFEHLGVWGATGRFTALTVRRVPAGATVRITCKGKGCRKKKITKKVRKAASRLNLAKVMRRNNRLRPRALVEVRVTAPNRIGKVFQFRIRAFKPPVTKTLCLPPGAKRPRRCS